MAALNLTTPWVEHYRKIDAFFKNDPDVYVVYNNDEVEIKVYVDNAEKGGALDALLPDEVEFGNVTLKIAVIPANDGKLTIPRNITSVAFTGNPIVDEIRSITLFGALETFVLFKKEVVQYSNDDIGDYFGIESTLYENIARDIFSPQLGVYYCTNVD